MAVSGISIGRTDIIAEQALHQSSVGRHCDARLATGISPQVLPPPRGLNPRYVTWRGGVVWTRLDAMNDIWIKRQEWDEIGMKAYRNRMF
jgi:actin-related protein